VRERYIADLNVVVCVAHSRRQHRTPVTIRKTLRHGIAECRNERIGGAQINTDSEATRVWLGAFAGFGDLEKCHGS
jgi:hypothetical protein